jgi:hypothetical protein
VQTPVRTPFTLGPGEPQAITRWSNSPAQLSYVDDEGDCCRVTTDGARAMRNSQGWPKLHKHAVPEL